jgi:hypothetical protein
MSFVGDIFSGDKGAGFQASGAPILEAVDRGQTEKAYAQTQEGIAMQNAFIQALQAQNGIQNQSDVFAQQKALAGQLQDASMGQGPNPAMAQLQQTTGQNVANQAALMAGQRGANANVGLMARQVGQQGGAIQQQAAGQGALMSAQQQLAARAQLQQQQAMMGGLATQQVGQQGSAIQGYNQAAQGSQQNLLNAVNALNNASVSNVASQNSANAGVAGVNAKTQGGIVGGTLKGLSSMAGFSEGGMVDGNEMPTMPEMPDFVDEEPAKPATTDGPMSAIGRFFSNMPMQSSVEEVAANPIVAAAGGGHVPGKAIVAGDSVKNDNVPALLSPGEVVIPRSVMHSKDPVAGAAKFVAAVMAKKGVKGNSK